MKRIICAFFGLVLSGAIFGQATLPTSWSFTTTTYPTGWTPSGTTFYAASGNTPPACRFDNTGDLLTIFFNSAPGNISYYLTGNSFSGGTFIIEESPDGITYTTIRSITSPPNGTYTLFNDVANSASRYIRFNYLNKVSGNIGLDDVTINPAAASPAQEINITQSGNTIVNGGTHILSSPVSSTTPTTFVIENLGTTNTLTISSATLSGTDAAMFSVTSFPSSVNASSTGNLMLDFTPTSAGTKYATLTIVNDDADENPYIIYLYGIGGNLATQPSAQATNLNFTNIKSYRFNASFTPASGSPEGYIVLRRNGAAVTDVPVDGAVYTRGDIIGNSQVVYSGSATAFVPNATYSSSTYHFAVFTYNGPGVYRNYLTTSPLTGNVTTLGSMQPASYYSTINTSSASFVMDLHNKINPHNMQFYGSYGGIMMSNFYARDTVGDQRVVTCSYSGLNKMYTEPWDWTSNDFSREHTYCHSWMPTYPSTTGPEYQDYHQIYPANQNNVNAIRSNYPLGVVVNASYTYLGCKLGTDASGKTVFEPRDEYKGDAARAMMYQAICYTTVAGNNWGFPNPISGTIPYGQDQNILKQWHFQDPPSLIEISRNDYVDSVQGNRNPFIDSANYVCYIDFTNMTKISSPALPCNTVGLNELDKYQDAVYVYPNPNNGIFTINYSTTENKTILLEVVNLLGEVVYQKQLQATVGLSNFNIDQSSISKGLYQIRVVSEKGTVSQKIIIQ